MRIWERNLFPIERNFARSEVAWIERARSRPPAATDSSGEWKVFSQKIFPSISQIRPTVFLQSDWEYFSPSEYNISVTKTWSERPACCHKQLSRRMRKAFFPQEIKNVWIWIWTTKEVKINLSFNHQSKYQKGLVISNFCLQTEWEQKRY